MSRDIRQRDISYAQCPICSCRTFSGLLLRSTIFASHLHHFYKIGSTNTAAMTAAADGAPEGSVFLAEEQTAGRGRGANSWQSPRSTGIYCSVILRPELAPSDVLTLSLAAGLAVQSAIRDVDSRVQVDLKWPNDVLIQGKKVCGILAEMNAEATRVRYIVVGIGINVNQSSFPRELSATSLRLATGSEWSRVELVGALLKSLDREYRQLVSDPDAKELIRQTFRCKFVVGPRERGSGSKRTDRPSKERVKASIREAFCRCGRLMEYGRF